MVVRRRSPGRPARHARPSRACCHRRDRGCRCHVHAPRGGSAMAPRVARRLEPGYGPLMIRLIAATLKHPTNRTMREFHRYWADSHGPLCAQAPDVRRYALHLTLDEAYGDEPAPTFDGASISSFDDLDALLAHATRPESIAMWTATFVDDALLFDRATSWPTDHRKAGVVGTAPVMH